MTSRTQAANGQRTNLGELGYPTKQKVGSTLYEDFLPQLKGIKAIRVYEEMNNNDGVVGGILLAIDMMLRQVPWRVEGEDERAVELLTEAQEGLTHSWEDFVSSVMSMLPFGFSFFEVVYERRDGKIMWRKFAPRAQETLIRWIVDDKGGLEAFVQSTPDGPVTIPITKGLLFRTSTLDARPEGRSVLRRAYRPWFFKKRIEEYEAIGVERKLAGLPHARIPADDINANGATLQAYKDMVTRTRRDEQAGFITPSDRDEQGNLLYDMTLVTGSGDSRGSADTRSIVNGKNQEIAVALMADFVLLGHTAVGSRALAEPKQDLFLTSLEAWLDAIAGVLNRHAVPKLLAFNGMDPFGAELVHGDVRNVDMGEMGEYLMKTAQAGFPWTGYEDESIDTATVNRVREIGGFDPLPEDTVASEALLAQQEAAEARKPEFVSDNAGAETTTS